MDIKQLRYFLEIAETLNITKAAERLHMSQPPLTHQLKVLEEELGVKLFHRTTRKLEITEAGERLRIRAKQLMELAEITKGEIVALEEGKVKELVIGFVASSIALLSPEKLKTFHERYEALSFTMKEGNTHKILDLLNHGLIDLGLVRTPFNAEPYNVVYLPAEPMIAVYDPNTYELNKEISLSALKDKPLVLDKRFLELIVATAQNEGFEPKIICNAEDSRSLLSWTEAGLGVAILPLSGRKFIRKSELKYTVINSKALETRNAIVTLKSQKAPLVNDFIKLIQQVES